MSSETRPKPLAGVRVLDLTRLLPGPLCTQHLADMGADVIKIEAPREGDGARRLGTAQDGEPVLFAMLNRNKRSLQLDLKQPEGGEIFRRLAAPAEVIVESFRPGVVERLGIDYPSIRALNPGIVYCAISGYGQSGDYRQRAGHDLNYCALTGISDQNGPPGAPPSLQNFQIADLVGGTLSAAMGILAALLDARATGLGRYVDVSMSDCALAHAVFPLAALIGRGSTPPRGCDLLTGALPCYNLYETADTRHMAVGALERKFWDRFCKVIGRPDLQPFHLAEGEKGQWVKRELADLFRERTQAHWIERFDPVDCCVTPVLDIEETSRDPHFRQREMFLRHDDGSGRLAGLAFPVRFSGFEFAVERRAPDPGQHSAEILREIGISPTQIARLRENSVI